jgi:aryl-alcohol dehydrogenase-like predicted oxidoreductase
MMRYKLLGHSGLRVSELCLGTMTFGETWGWGASKTESKKMFDLFAKEGGNFIDTSVNYTDGTAEEFLGEFLKTDRDHFVVATKYTLTKPDDTDPNGGGNSRKNMMKSIECSLKRLQTDHIDIYYLHMWDYMTPVEEIAHGLDDLVRQGKFPTWHFPTLQITSSPKPTRVQTSWAGPVLSACRSPIHFFTGT